jgi:hypothetical protein
MKLASALAGLSAILLLGNAAPRVAPQIAPLTSQELAEFRTDSDSFRAYPNPPLPVWESDLRQALSGGDLDHAADALAPRYGMASGDMRALVRLWLTAHVRQYRLRRDTGGPAEAVELRRRLLALLPATHRAPLVLQAVAEGLGALTECSGEDFAAMMAGSADAPADAWTIANAAPCGDNFVRAAAAAPDRAMPALVRLANDGSLAAADELPLYQWLTSPAALLRVAEADRPLLSAWLYSQHARLMFRMGLTNRAIALIDALPREMRDRVLALPSGKFVAHIDGLPVALRFEHADETTKLDLAAAYAVSGRNAEAEALFQSLSNVAAARHAFDCAWQPDRAAPDQSCANIPYEQRVEQVIDLLILDHLLHHPGEDPYPLAESGFASAFGGSSGDALVELRCRVFFRATLCGDLRRHTQGAALSDSGRLCRLP